MKWYGWTRTDRGEWKKENIERETERIEERKSRKQNGPKIE